jgi:hypothetical protein
MLKENFVISLFANSYEQVGYIGHVDKLIMISYLYSYVKTILKKLS